VFEGLDPGAARKAALPWLPSSAPPALVELTPSPLLGSVVEWLVAGSENDPLPTKALTLFSPSAYSSPSLPREALTVSMRIRLTCGAGTKLKIK
jgi:hypothetical protein